MDVDGAPRWRWGAVTLAAWYAAAVLAAVTLGALLLGPGFLAFGSRDDDLVQPCDDPMECGPLFPDAGQVLRVVVPFLMVSLVIAVPLLTNFTRRRWPQVLAGSLAAALAWLTCLAGACVLLASVRLLRPV